jgi:hypothetical protein
MLRQLIIDHVGPADHLEANFAPRLNIITGDNSLGKSFLLDVAYWCFTARWPAGHVAIPMLNGEEIVPWICWGTAKDGESYQVPYDRDSQTWGRPALLAKPPSRMSVPPAITFYANADQGVSLCHTPQLPIGPAGQGSVYSPLYRNVAQFTSAECFNGKIDERSINQVCNGLVADWRLWQTAKASSKEQRLFSMLSRCVLGLSDPDDQIEIEEPRRVFLDDSRHFPTLRLRSTVIPSPHWSSSLRRVLSWAYLLVWSWHEYVENCQLMGRQPTGDIVLLIDEIETHLHPTWQRRILPALLSVVKDLAPEANVQLFVTTHSPMVLASLEPHFEVENDKLFLFEQTASGVEFTELPWANYGDADNWLTSRVFGLKQPRSLEAEQAIADAQAFMLSDRSDSVRRAEINDRLERYLTPADRFWNRWNLPTRP